MIENWLRKGMEIILSIVMILIVAILSTNVFLRYVFGKPFSWAEEVAVILIIWLTFIAAAFLQMRNEHVKITYIYDSLPKKLKNIVLWIGNAAILGVLGIHLIAAVMLVKIQCKSFTPALGLPMSCCSAALLIGIAIMFFLVLKEILFQIRKQIASASRERK